MGPKVIAKGGAADVVADPFKALNDASGRLFGEEANAQGPGLGFDEDEAVLVFAGAGIELARPIHIPGFAGVA